jgi:TonB family protein
VKLFGSRLTRAAVLFGVVMCLALPPAILSQDTGADASKRKVRAKVAPVYPNLAKKLNVEGKVKVEVTITADGRVKTTRIVGGSPLLSTAATDAVKQWKFEPAAKDSTEIIEFEFKNPAN